MMLTSRRKPRCTSHAEAAGAVAKLPYVSAWNMSRNGFVRVLVKIDDATPGFYRDMFACEAA